MLSMKAIIEKVKASFNEVKEPKKIKTDLSKKAFVHVATYYQEKNENWAIGCFSSNMKTFTRYAQNLGTLEIYTF